METYSRAYGGNIRLVYVVPTSMEARLRNSIDVPETWVIQSAVLQEHLTQATALVTQFKAEWVGNDLANTAIIAIAASLAYAAFCDHAESHIPTKIDKTGYWKHDEEIRQRQNRAAKSALLAGNADKWFEMIKKRPGVGPRLEMMI